MKLLEIESWAIRALEQLEKNTPVEDSRVELKAEWPDAAKAARRIAGQANAARGEHFLWLIGADEKRGVIGADFQELSDWWNKVQSAFESLAPGLQDLNVPYKGKTIAALCFDSSRAPFVVKNPAYGKTPGESVKYEVPWREGTAVRTATRTDLVLLLAPASRLPKCEPLRGEIFAKQKGENFTLELNIKVYITPTSTEPITFPFHRCAAVVSAESEILSENFRVTICSAEEQVHQLNRQRNALLETLNRSSEANKRSATTVNVEARAKRIESTTDEILIHGPGKIVIVGKSPIAPASNWPRLRLVVELTEAVTEAKTVLDQTFLRRQTPELIWDFGDHF